MEEENKTSFISIIIVFALLALLVVIIIKMINHNKEEDNTMQEIQMTSEYEVIYNSMVTKDKYFGLYFGEKTTIDDIDENDMIKYMLTKYMDENNIKVNNNILCFSDGKGNYTGKIAKESIKNECNSITKINKIALDNFIKEKYNTQRTFNSKNGQLPLSTSIEYVFDGSQTYYLGNSDKEIDYHQIIRMLTRIEGDNDTLVFYDKAMYCKIGWGSAECLKTNNKAYGVIFEIAEKDYNNDRKELIIKDTTSDDGHKYTSYEFDYNYIFEHYETFSFKHTFKKINDNYYWMSSEVL